MVQANTDKRLQQATDIMTLEDNTDALEVRVSAIPTRILMAQQSITLQMVDNGRNQMTIDSIMFPKLIEDYYSINSVDLELMGTFAPLGLPFQICPGRQFDFWASASGWGTAVENPMTTLRL